MCAKIILLDVAYSLMTNFEPRHWFSENIAQFTLITNALS